MKKLLTRTLLAVSLLGVGFAFTSLNDYAGLPSVHSPGKNVVQYELAGLPSVHSIQLYGLPSVH